MKLTIRDSKRLSGQFILTLGLCLLTITVTAQAPAGKTGSPKPAPKSRVVPQRIDKSQVPLSAVSQETKAKSENALKAKNNATRAETAKPEQKVKKETKSKSVVSPVTDPRMTPASKSNAVATGASSGSGHASATSGDWEIKKVKMKNDLKAKGHSDKEIEKRINRVEKENFNKN